ncbi:MAG: PAS domain S-box protein, partial [Bdellovibrionota bacterium]
DFSDAYASFFELSPVALRLCDPEGRTLSVNLIYRELFGGEPADGTNVLETGAAGRREDLPLLRRAFAGEPLCLPPFWYECQGKGRVLLEVQALPMRSPVGRIRYVALFYKDITPQERLRESEARLRKAQAIAHVGIWDAEILSPEPLEFGKGSWSEEAWGIWGYEPGEVEVTAELFFGSIHPDDQARVSELCVETVRSKKPYTTEYRIRRKDGAERIVFERGEVLCEKSTGRPVKLFGTCQDITERKQAEAAIARLAAVLEATTDIVSMGDLAGNLLYMNRPGRRLLGYGEEEDLSGKKIGVFHGPAVFELLSRVAVPAAMRDGTWSGETTMRTKYGRDIPVSQVVIAHKGAGGKVEYLSTIARDIRPQKEAEQAIAERERFVREIVTAAPQIIYVLELEPGGIPKTTFINRPFCEALGHASPPDLAREWAFLIPLLHPDDRGRAPSLIERWKALKDGEVLEGDYRLRNAKGEWRWFHGRDVVLDRRPDGSVCRILGSAHDLTEKKQLEEQLRQAQKIEAVGRLTGGIAHDFNNLLTVVNGNALLLERLLPKEGRERAHCREIVEAGERGAALTRQLLAFSRKQILEPRRISLNDTVRQMSKILSRLLGEDVKLTLHLAHDLGTTFADPSQVEQVILNLAVNARDAMPEGGELFVETANGVLRPEDLQGEADAKPGPCVKLLVRDTGCGMDEETLSRVFEPFFTTKELGKGTGLGLSTVYGIVKQSGGHIRVESEPGKGTVFEISLPQFESRPVLSPAPLDGFPPSRGRETILFVEDEPMIRSVVRETLSELGYTVLVAESADQALSLAERHDGEIDLLLTDVILPRTNGARIAERVKALRPLAKVLFTSGYTDDMIAPHGVLEEGMHFLSKPFSPDQLARKIRELLDAPP